MTVLLFSTKLHIPDYYVGIRGFIRSSGIEINDDYIND